MVLMQDPIQLTNLDEELSRLREAEQSKNKIRASLFNLIIYVQKAEKASIYQSLVKSVMSKFPCRVMLIVSDENPEAEYLRTSVKAETLGEGQQQVYCEIIQIEVAGKLSERVPFIILPEILPDLPVYLLWTQDPTTENTVLPHLEPFADRIIFDSESAASLQTYCKAVLSLMERFRCEIGDLNWNEITGWRTVLSQTFNDQESILSLAQSSMIRIIYNSLPTQRPRHIKVEAAYLHAWIASRLNWKFQALEINEGNVRLTYRRSLQEVVFLLLGQEEKSLPSGAILGVEIESVKNQGHYSFKRHPESNQVLIQYSEKDHCRLPCCTALSAGQEILAEIFSPSGGQHYRETIETLSQIPWRRGE